MTNREPPKIEAQRTFPPLDENLYNLRPQDAAFYKELTGIKDDAALKQHILDVQAKAYKVSRSLNTSFCPKLTCSRLGCTLRVHLSFPFHEVFYSYICAELIHNYGALQTQAVRATCLSASCAHRT
jgi:hypothetical protein